MPGESVVPSENLENHHRRMAQAVYSNHINAMLTMKRIIRSLTKRRSAYLTDKALERLNIQCTGLGLNTGMPSDGSEIFIRPFQTTKIHSILEEIQPWHEYQMTYDRSFGRYSSAQGILCCIYAWLTCTRRDPLPSLIRHTDWDVRQMEYDEGERLCRYPRPPSFRSPYWDVAEVLDKMDGLTPHVSCLLNDDAPLGDAQLSNAEVWCILAITYRRFRQREYRNHRFIPVTIISASDMQVRIVQGYVDAQGDCVRVRKSPILDFEDFEQARKHMEVILSWCIGETVGDTKLKTT
ncbi:hypothetical protein GGR58DRAFT_273000 [Xylaria digitata]|nr:hypothetical protein GGR58DRAFT_273000 [Xylaria digitata]